MGVTTDWASYLAEHEQDCIGAAVLDETFRIRAVSDAVLVRGGFTREQLFAMSALDVLHPEDVERAVEVLADAHSIPGRRAEGLYRLMRADGVAEAIGLRAHNLGPEHQNILVLQLDEVSAELRAKAFAEGVVQAMQLLVEERPIEQCLERILSFGHRHVDGLTLALTVFGEGGGARTFCRHALDPQVSAEHEAAHPLSLPPHVAAAFAQFEHGPWKAHIRPGIFDPRVPRRITMALADSEHSLIGYLEAFRATDDEPDDSEWLVYGLVARVVTAMLLRNRLDEQLRHAADHDPLTGLFNRRRILERMSGAPCLDGSGVLVLDVDQFAWVNNTLGHAFGDMALVSVAECLTVTCPSEALIARLGGDEFVVWVPDPASSDAVHQLADRIREAMIVPIASGDQRMMVRCSIGVAIGQTGESAESAINRADQAMYNAKRAGGDQVRAS